MHKDIQNVVAVFVHLSLASVFGLNVALVATGLASRHSHCSGCVTAATMLISPAPIRTAVLFEKPRR